MTISSIFVSVSACAFWGYVGVNVLTWLCNPRTFADWLDKAIHRACAAHEALSAGLDAWDSYKGRNAASWETARAQEWRSE